MSNYTKLTDFASKDSLPSGNAAKIVKGTEIDDEFEAIEQAIATKADTISPTLTGTPLAPTASAGTTTTQIATTAFVQAQKASPAFTGTPTAPTAAVGTNTTQISTTEFVQTALQQSYPVGSVYINASDGTDPSSLLGFGTWEAFAAGQVLVGLDSTDPEFDTAGETGGTKDITTTGEVGSTNLMPFITVYMWKRTA